MHVSGNEVTLSPRTVLFLPSSLRPHLGIIKKKSSTMPVMQGDIFMTSELPLRQISFSAAISSVLLLLFFKILGVQDAAKTGDRFNPDLYWSCC